MLLVLSPVLTRTGYGMNFLDGIVITWGGLRGAVGLILALRMALSQPDVGNKVLSLG